MQHFRDNYAASNRAIIKSATRSRCKDPGCGGAAQAERPDEQPQSDVLLQVVDHVPAPSLPVDGDIEANPGPKGSAPRLPGQQDISAFFAKKPRVDDGGVGGAVGGVGGGYGHTLADSCIQKENTVPGPGGAPKKQPVFGQFFSGNLEGGQPVGEARVAGGAGEPVVPQSSTSRDSVAVDIIKTQHPSAKRLPEIEITGARIAYIRSKPRLFLKGDMTAGFPCPTPRGEENEEKHSSLILYMPSLRRRVR
jgi:hypothetical protein